MSGDAGRFSCSECGRKFIWRIELAGKRVKCKCGEMMHVPKDDPSGGGESAAAPRKVAKVLPMSAASGAGTATIPYRSAPTTKDKPDRFSAANLIDMPRDVYAPTAIFVVGVLLSITYMNTAYHFSSQQIGFLSILITAILLLKTLLLIGFAFVIAGPIGVSFGSPWTAMLKLGAVAILCDGITSWVGYAVEQSSGPRGGVSPYVGQFFTALLVYWISYAYLFSMDGHESWIVGRILFICDRVLKWGLILMIAGMLPHRAGAAMAHNTSALIANPAAASDPMTAQVMAWKDADQLTEARAYLARGNQAVFNGPVNDWYAQGCTNVWFVMTHADINGRQNATGVLLELPADPASRAKCFDTLRKYYDAVQIPYIPSDIKDTGQVYQQVLMR
jgi:hypothetical protein